jgi:5S rRNA maturation endonuclease (ribonuclease M5)
LLKINKYDAKEIIKKYKGLTRSKPAKVIIRRKGFKLPTGITELQQNHKNYLIKRNFNPDELIKLWDIKGTGPMSKLDKISYKFGIFIPIYWKGKLVSFQTRDITNKQSKKYMICPKDREVISLKDIVYRNPECTSDIGICCEGVTDVWRLGMNAFCTFGVQYKRKQLRLISKLYKRVFILYDNDTAGKIQGNKLLADLKFAGVEAIKIDIDNDPGSMKQEDANYLVNQLIKS